VKRSLRGADVPVNKNTLLSLITSARTTSPSLAVDKVRLQGRAGGRDHRGDGSGALAARKLVRVDYDPLRRCSMSRRP
jgi:hypothetical protein